MSRRLAPAAGSARSFRHSPKPPYGAPATRLRVSSPARTRSTTTFGGVTYDVARQILMGHGRCAKIWPQLRLTKSWSRRAEARGSCRAFTVLTAGRDLDVETPNTLEVAMKREIPVGADIM